jgi:thiol-disulfide isomerase/thioredoxin
MKSLVPAIKNGLLLLLLAAWVTGCVPRDKKLKTGTWRGVLHIANQQVPFLMEVVTSPSGQPLAYLINGQERILLDDIQVRGDSVKIPLHIFDADLRARINETEDELKGVWTRYHLQQPFRISFSAHLGQEHRFEQHPKPATFSYAGKWDVVFTDAAGKEEKAIGLFQQKGNQLTGTFLSATGDYRYLDGQVNSDTLLLSTFDGANGYLFRAWPLAADQVQGQFFQGPNNKSTWTAQRNDQAALPAADTLTYLKPGYKQLSFTFPDLSGRQVSLSDPKYRGKVVVVQLMGSWCPNCMDETAYLAPFYRRHRNRGLEIIGLGYEQSPEFALASKRLKRLKDRYQIDYDILVAGVRDPESAASTLPMLNHVLAFPTTIILDRKGEVRRIHTGFSGPGTGKYYEEFIRDFETTINKLLAE